MGTQDPSPDEGPHDGDGQPGDPPPPQDPWQSAETEMFLPGQAGVPVDDLGGVGGHPTLRPDDDLGGVAPHPTAVDTTRVRRAPTGPDPQLGEHHEPHFENPWRQKPQQLNKGRGKFHPTVPWDPLRPYISWPKKRKRRSDWPVLVIALIVTATVLVMFCLGGFALFRKYGVH